MKTLETTPFAALMPVLLARSPAALGEGVAELFAAQVGWDLLTVLKCDHGLGVTRRIYSSDAENHPVGGQKPFNPLVMREGFVAGREVHRCRSQEEVARSYSNDAKALRYCGSINIPVVWNAELVGMVNLLRLDTDFEEIEDASLLAMAALALPLFVAG